MRASRCTNNGDSASTGVSGHPCLPQQSPEDDWETSMDNMYDLCRDGGLVFIPATNTPKIEGGLLGQVPAHSDIELRDYEARKASGEKTMKTHQLRRVREVHPNDGTGVFAEVNWGNTPYTDLTRTETRLWTPTSNSTDLSPGTDFTVGRHTGHLASSLSAHRQRSHSHVNIPPHTLKTQSLATDQQRATAPHRADARWL